MNLERIPLLLLFISLISSCTNEPKSNIGSTMSYGKENVDAKKLEKDFVS